MTRLRWLRARRLLPRGQQTRPSTFDAFSSALPHAAPSAGRFLGWGSCAQGLWSACGKRKGKRALVRGTAYWCKRRFAREPIVRTGGDLVAISASSFFCNRGGAAFYLIYFSPRLGRKFSTS